MQKKNKKNMQINQQVAWGILLDIWTMPGGHSRSGGLGRTPAAHWPMKVEFQHHKCDIMSSLAWPT